MVKRYVLHKFLEKHIYKPRDWEVLSNNPGVTTQFIQKHIHKPWDWRDCGLSK